MIFMTSAGGWSSGMRTGFPPACSTARSYWGIARSAYSRSIECGMGIAMRGGISAHPFDRGQCPRLAVVADFHGQRQHKDDASRYCGRGQGNAAVGDGHVGVDAAQGRYDDGPDDTQEQADGERDESEDERHQQDAHWDGIPAGWARHASNLHHSAVAALVDHNPELREHGSKESQ